VAADPDNERKRWTPELGGRELSAIASVLDALNAAETEIADGEVGLSFQGVLEVTIDDTSYNVTHGTDNHHAIMHMGILMPVDAACWRFVPGDVTDRNTGEWGGWAWLPWPGDTVRAVVDAARALCPPLPEGAYRLKSIVVDGVEQIDPRREALQEALDALDKSAYTLCSTRQHVTRGDHLGKDGTGCDHRYTDGDDRVCGDRRGESGGDEAPSLPG
jgi:hypothetical protein